MNKQTIFITTGLVLVVIIFSFFSYYSEASQTSVIGKYYWFEGSETDISGVKGSNYVAEELCNCAATTGVGILEHIENVTVLEPWIICGDYRTYNNKTVEVNGIVKRIYIDREKREFGYEDGCANQEIYGCYKGYVNCITINSIKILE